MGELWARGVDAQVELGTRNPGNSGWRAQFAGTWQSSRVGFREQSQFTPLRTRDHGSDQYRGMGRSDRRQGGARHTGARTTSLAATRLLEGFTTMDLSARYHFDAGSLVVTLFSRLENVLDRQYELIELYPEPGRNFTFRLEARRDIQ